MSQYLGDISAYALAVSQGYTGTEEEYAELMASYADVGQTAVDAKDAAVAAKTAAQTAATTATNKAAEATTAAQTATTKAGEASTSASTATSAKDTAVSASQTATTKATEATTAAATAVSAKDDAVSANTAAQSAKTAAQTAQTGAETAAASVQSSAAQIQTNTDDISELKEDLTQKANQDGYYADLVSGGSTQLLSDMVETDTTPYNYRTAGGSLEIGDREKLKKIVGGSLAVNQLANKSSFPATTTTNDITFTNNGDGSVTVSGTATANAGYQVISERTFQAHKYCLFGCPSSGANETYSLRMVGQAADALDVGNGTIWDAAGNTWKGMKIVVKNGTAISTAITFKPQLIDLTAMFGSTIADYIYSLETATTGAGVAWLKAHFPKIFDSGYIPYNAGTLEHVSGLSAHKMTGFNQWDEEWEVGSIDASGNNDPDPSRIRSKNYTAVLPNTNYYFNAPYTLGIRWYAEDKSFISGTSISASSTNKVMESPSNACYLRFSVVGTTTYNHDICINLHWGGERDGEYEPYEEHNYPIDSDVTLRGIPELDANNNLYYDGDEYVSDGTVTRRYGIVDLGTLDWNYEANYNRHGTALSNAKAVSTSVLPNLLCPKYEIVTSSYGWTNRNSVTAIVLDNNGWLRIYNDGTDDASAYKAAMSGVYLLYELAEPTTESADHYTEIQNVSNWGTEEFVSECLVPVGHETAYQPDLRAKIEVAPESPDTDGYYLMKRENGENAYVAYLGELPSDPTTDGTYTLKCTVASGTATKTWEADE